MEREAREFPNINLNEEMGKYVADFANWTPDDVKSDDEVLEAANNIADKIELNAADMIGEAISMARFHADQAYGDQNQAMFRLYHKVAEVLEQNQDKRAGVTTNHPELGDQERRVA